MSVLSQSQIRFWEDNGYVVVPDAVPKENLERLVDALWKFLEMEPNNPADWYKYKPYTRENLCSPIGAAGMVARIPRCIRRFARFLAVTSFGSRWIEPT